MLLAHATPVLHGGVLRLQFARADIAAAWQDSGAQTALDAALEHQKIDVRVETVTRSAAA
ncbi:hypothetical protein ACIBBD_02060 [Streptomyces sp. NPDC051315]|uniref:hypothetical protein n=1 Tax=Streptomyces sp. NPDC051315 TaxID=3365650 RepID=UPI0037A50F92